MTKFAIVLMLLWLSGSSFANTFTNCNNYGSSTSCTSVSDNGDTSFTNCNSYGDSTSCSTIED